MAVDNKITIVALPNYWGKAKLSIGISETKPTKMIASNEYHCLVVEAIDIWQKTLHKYAPLDNECNNLNEIVFNISDKIRGDEDIIVKWWFSNPLNGQTRFAPMMGNIERAEIFIAKCNGPDIPSMEKSEESYNGIPIVRTHEQIKSVALHEFGHALGLGHCSYYKDMMHTGSINPDTNRRISSLDLKIISQSFKVKIQDKVLIPFSILKSQWTDVQQ